MMVSSWHHLSFQTENYHFLPPSTYILKLTASCAFVILCCNGRLLIMFTMLSTKIFKYMWNSTYAIRKTDEPAARSQKLAARLSCIGWSALQSRNHTSIFQKHMYIQFFSVRLKYMRIYVSICEYVYLDVY